MPTKKPELSPRIKSELANSPFLQRKEPHLTVKHCANLGDIVAMMASLKKYSKDCSLKIRLLQVLNFPGNYYPGAKHPTVSESGDQVTMNKAMFDMAKPLVESQSYISSFDVYGGELIDLDLDVIRTKIFVGLPNLMLQSWPMYAYPDLATDLSKPWIDLPKSKKYEHIRKQVAGKVILNFTERYHSENLDFLFLRQYAKELIFAGTEKEKEMFCRRWQLDIKQLQIKNFLEYAYAIKYSKFIFGNQSFGWNLAQAMQHPRLVELCRFAPNVQPYIGEKSYGFFHQQGATWGFSNLFANT